MDDQDWLAERFEAHRSHVPGGAFRMLGSFVDAFLAAARAGDFERLLAVLDPEVVLRSDGGVARPALMSLPTRCS